MDQEFLKLPPYTAQTDFKGKYTASCFCGNVVFEIAEEPLGMVWMLYALR